MARREPFLIAYDISDPKRLRRVHRLLGKWGCPVQYSVFVADLSPHGLDRLTSLLNKIVDPEDDDLRIYRMPMKTGIWIGSRPHGDGIVLTGHSGLDTVEGMVKRGGFTNKDE